MRPAGTLVCTVASAALGLSLLVAPTATATAAAAGGAGGTSAGRQASTRGRHRHGHRSLRRGSQAHATSGGTGAAVQPPAPPNHAPVLAHGQTLHYSGPIYEIAASGQVVPYEAPAVASTTGQTTGGAAAGVTTAGKPKLLVPGRRARFIDGLAAAPMEAPAAVQQMIWAANTIIGLPYIYGGGHQSFQSDGYDCSGTVSFALHGAGLLKAPEDSSELEAFGGRGVGEWVTIFANAGHTYMDIAGLRLDTSPAEDPSGLPGPRWRPLRETNAGFVVRHPIGL